MMGKIDVRIKTNVISVRGKEKGFRAKVTYFTAGTFTAFVVLTVIHTTNIHM